MGSLISKASRSSPQVVRKYPTRVPPTDPAPQPPPPGQTTAPGPSVRPKPQASEFRDESASAIYPRLLNILMDVTGVALDATDPQFAQSLRSLGPVQPASTLSNSSTFSPSATPAQPTNGSQQQIFPNPSLNPSLQVMLARERIEKEIQEETAQYNAGRKVERSYMDVGSIRKALAMYDSGASSIDIERDLKLQKGLVKKMGIGSVVGLPSGELLTDKDRDDGLMKDR